MNDVTFNKGSVAYLVDKNTVRELIEAIRYLADRHYDAVKLQTEVLKRTQDGIVDLYKESVDKIVKESTL